MNIKNFNAKETENIKQLQLIVDGD